MAAAAPAEGALPRLLPPARIVPVARTADVLPEVAKRHPELLAGPERDGQMVVLVIARADGTVESTQLLQPPSDETTGTNRPAQAPVQEMSGGALSVFRLSKGTAAPGGTLKVDLQVIQTVRIGQPARVDPLRAMQRVHTAMLAEHAHLLLPFDGNSFNQATVFMTEDGRIDRLYVALKQKEQLRPYGDINPLSFATQWEPLGLAPEQLGTMGITNIYSGTTPGNIQQRKWMIVRYAWPRRPGEPIGGTPESPATAAQARQAPFTHTEAARVIDHYLPGALNSEGASPQGIPWLVLSRDGAVLHSGYLTPPSVGAVNPVERLSALPELQGVRLAEMLPMTVVRQYATAYASVLLAWEAPGSDR